MPEISHPNRRRRARTVARAALLIVPFVALLSVGSYAGDTPRLWGFPFFYWYQLLWVVLTPACLWTAYPLTGRAAGGARL